MQAESTAADRMAFRADANLRAAIEEAARADERSMTSFLRKAVIDELTRRGFWPREHANKERQ